MARRSTWTRVLGTLALGALAGSAGMASSARAETAQIGGWFVSDERLADGTFSHCMMLNPYLNGERKVLLSFTLSKDRLAMLAVSDSDWTMADSDAYQGKIAFDGGKPQAMKTTNAGGVARMEVEDWTPFARTLTGAKLLAVKSSEGVVSFNLYDVTEAVRALESCAMTGHPPTIRRVVRDDKGNVVKEEVIAPVKEPVPDIVPKRQ
jgi:hypothetical protein